MADFANKYLKQVFNTIHILPFYPYSSDRGFFVKDFKEVGYRLGTWEDIKELGTECAHLKETHAIIKLFRDILDIDKRLFVVLRCDNFSKEGILSVVNVSNKSFSVDFLRVKELFKNEANIELISNKRYFFRKIQHRAF